MSLRSLIERRLQDAAGVYLPNHFLLSLDKGTPFISGTRDAETQNEEYFHVFLHEYWHYWQNVSTVSGFKSFSFTQHQLALFSWTLRQHANGESVGSTALDPNGQTNLGALVALQFDLDGVPAPSEKLALDWDVRTEVFGVVNYDRSETYQGKLAPNPMVDLKVRCSWTGAPSQDETMTFGALAVEESVAYLVEEQVRVAIGKSASSPPPEFPYRIPERVLSWIVGQDVEPFVAAALGTLALLSTHPGPVFVELARKLKTAFDRTGDLNSALAAVVSLHKTLIDACVGDILKVDLPELEALHAGRGLSERALKHISSTIRRALDARLADPLFDLKPFFPTLDVTKLRAHYTEFPSCDLLQEVKGDDDLMERDTILGMDKTPADADGFTPSDYTRAFQAQQDYLLAHLDHGTGGFTDSTSAESRCPYYTACDQDQRKVSPGDCATKPWRVYQTKGIVCWYGTAVAATIGKVNINKLKP